MNTATPNPLRSLAALAALANVNVYRNTVNTTNTATTTPWGEIERGLGGEKQEASHGQESERKDTLS